MVNKLTLNEATQEIIQIHNGIMQSLRRAVPDAIRIGQIITEQKELLEHGQFLPWIETLPFSHDTARNYQRLYLYSGKIRNVRNLQEAYKKIESLEAIERRQAEDRKWTMIRERLKTGVIPNGWDSAYDEDYDRRLKSDQPFVKLKDGFEWPKKDAEPEKQRITSEQLKEAADLFIEKQNRIDDFKERIKLSDSGKDDAFIDAIMEYLDGLENDNRRIEACNNIIKVCRNIATGLHGSA